MNFTAERFFGDVESADPDLREMALSDLEKCLSSQEGKTLFASKWPAMVEKVLFRMSAEEQNYSVRQKSVGAIPRIIVASDPDTQQTILSRLLEMAVSPSQDVRDSARRSLERGSNAIAEQSAANIVFWQAEVCVVHNFLQKIERCAEREENDFVFAYVRTLADQFGRVCKSLLSRIMMLALRGFKNGKLDYNVSSCVTAMIAFVDSKTRSSVFLSIAEAFQRDETFPNGSTLLGALATLDAPFVSGESEKFVGFLQNVDYSAKAGNVVLAAVKLLRVLTTKCDLSTDTKDTLTSRLLTVYSAQSEAATSQAQNADASSDSEYECYDYYDDNDGADSDANLIKAEILLLMQNVCANDASAVCATVMKALQDNDDSVAKAALELLKKIDVTPLLKESALPAVLQGLFARNSDVALAALSAIGHLAALHPDKPSLASEPVAKAIIGFMKGDKWSLQEESLNTTCSVLASLGKCGGTLEIGAPLCECVAECLSQSTLAKLETKAAEVFPTVIDYVNAEGSESLAVKCVAVCKSRVLTNNTLPVQNRLEIVKSFVRNTAGSSNSPFLRPAANAASFELLLLCLKEPHLCHIVPDVLSTVSCAKFAELVSPEQSASLVEVLHETSLASRRCSAATLRILAERKMTLADGAKARCLAASFTETELFSEIVALWWTLLTNQIVLAESFPPQFFGDLWNFVSNVTCDSSDKYTEVVHSATALSREAYKTAPDATRNQLVVSVSSFVSKNRNVFVDCHAIVSLFDHKDEECMTRIIHSLEATAECKILCLGETGAVVKLDDNNSGKLLSGACNTDSESSRKAASAALSSAMRNPANFGLLVRCVERCAGGQKHGVPYLLRAVESAIKSCDQENRAKLPIEELLPVLCRIEYDVNYVEAVGSCIGEITAVSPTTFYTYLISCADWDKQDTGRLSLITGMRYALPHSPEITDRLLKAVNKCFSRYTSKDSIEERYALTRLLFVILDCAPGVLHRAEPTLTTGLLNELKEHKELITRMAKLDYKEDHGLPCRRAAYDCARRLITHKDATLTPLFKGGEDTPEGFNLIDAVIDGCGKNESDDGVKRQAMSTLYKCALVRPELITANQMEAFVGNVKAIISAPPSGVCFPHAAHLVFALGRLDYFYQNSEFYELFNEVCRNENLSKALETPL